MTRFGRRTWSGFGDVALAGFVCVAALGSAACSHASAAPPPGAVVAASAPPKDDGKASEGGSGGNTHAAALEELKIAAYSARADKQRSVRIPLPDAPSWTRVKFWGVKSLVGFRYGKEHHAIVGATITHVDDPTVPGACRQSFEAWAKPLLAAFDVEIAYDPPDAFVWKDRLVEVSSIYAHTATLLSNDEFAVAYGAYPMPEWIGTGDDAGKKGCLIVGIAIPARGEVTRAHEVRDRFVKEALKKVVVTGKTEPPERF